MNSLGFKRCNVDQAMFYRRKGSTLLIVLIHVDDCTITGTSVTLILKFKVEIGELNWILGIKVKRIWENRTIHLSQKAYIESMLQCYGFNNLKPISLPMEASMTHIRSVSHYNSTDCRYVQYPLSGSHWIVNVRIAWNMSRYHLCCPNHLKIS